LAVADLHSILTYLLLCLGTTGLWMGESEGVQPYPVVVALCASAAYVFTDRLRLMQLPKFVSNAMGVVILVTVGSKRILITADIEAPAEAWLVDSGIPLDADVLLIPHHGSKTSSTPPFIEAVHPAAAVVSTSATNPYGHPAEEVIARYEGTPVFRTDQQGNVTVTTDGTRLWIRTERD